MSVRGPRSRGSDRTVAWHHQGMRAKRTGRRIGSRRGADDPTPIDLGETARQVGLFESANGVPHGAFAIVLALILALLLLPMRAAWRALTRSTDR
jgi:hypothetical protein